MRNPSNNGYREGKSILVGTEKIQPGVGIERRRLTINDLDHLTNGCWGCGGGVAGLTFVVLVVVVGVLLV